MEKFVICDLCREEKLTPDLHMMDMAWTRLAQIGKLENLCWHVKIDSHWHQIGTDWQIGKFVSERKIGPRLAPDWHGLAWIGTDWHGLAWIGMDWHGLARIGKLANL